MLHRALFIVAILCALASCEKAEDAIVLPQKGSASVGSVELGATYDKQVFYDFESGKAVFTSSPASWDLAFEASATGRHVFLNGGQAVYVYNTHEQDMTHAQLPSDLSVTKDTGWQYDNPNGLPNGTAIGDWWSSGGVSKGEVYIVRIKTDLMKMRILSGDDSGYTIEWMPFSGGAASQVQLHKNSAVNCVYFSFSQGVTTPEPPDKTSWDVVFTQYRELVYDDDVYVQRAIPYIVTGALLNPNLTLAARDSMENFGAIGLSQAETIPLNTNRNAIGYDWKSVDVHSSSASYTVNSKKNYLLSTREAHLFKLHFLGFYNPTTGQKGTPIFEYQRLK